MILLVINVLQTLLSGINQQVNALRVLKITNGAHQQKNANILNAKKDNTMILRSQLVYRKKLEVVVIVLFHFVLLKLLFGVRLTKLVLFVLAKLLSLTKLLKNALNAQ